mmetsp:Transcript_149960/g.462946  ORF Transcript_149960/g.462946 Transcript_149960/m.462946 type:complete len:591 (-) Transcript_149960:130-1902(-)
MHSIKRQRRIVGHACRTRRAAVLCALAPLAAAGAAGISTGFASSWSRPIQRSSRPTQSQASRHAAQRQASSRETHGGDPSSSSQDDPELLLRHLGMAAAVVLLLLGAVFLAWRGAQPIAGAALGLLAGAAGLLSSWSSRPPQPETEEQAAERIDALRDRHHKARHAGVVLVHEHELAENLAGARGGLHKVPLVAKHAVAADHVTIESELMQPHGRPHDVDKAESGGRWDAVTDGIKTALFGLRLHGHPPTGDTADAGALPEQRAGSGVATAPPPAAAVEQRPVEEAAGEHQGLPERSEPPVEAAPAGEQRAAASSAAEARGVPATRPEVPGMAAANLVVSVSCEKQKTEPKSLAEGVKLLLEQSGGTILAAMAQDGWSVKPVDTPRGIYELSLPAVTYNLGMGTVSIPSPLFKAHITDSSRTDEEDDTERLVGDLILQNGQDILTVTLGFPFSTSLSVSAAGSARARIGRSQDAVYLQADVDIGLQIPKAPGLARIMQVFVRSYAGQSTKDCSVALSKGADKIESKSKAEVVASAVAAATAAAAMAATEVDVIGMAAEAGRIAVQTAGEAMLQPGIEEIPQALESLESLA